MYYKLLVVNELILKLLVYLNKFAGVYFFHSLSYHSLNDLQKAKESYTKVIISEFDVIIWTPLKCHMSFHAHENIAYSLLKMTYVIFTCSRIEKDFTCSLCSLVKYFLALEDKFHISVQTCMHKILDVLYGQ